MNDRIPTPFSSKELGCFAICVLVVFFLAASIVGNDSKPLFLFAAFIVSALIFVWNYSRSHNPRYLLRHLEEHRDITADRLDPRIWWCVSVVIPDQEYGGNQHDFWEACAVVYAFDEENAKRKAIDIVRKRNIKYDEFRKRVPHRLRWAD